MEDHLTKTEHSTQQTYREKKKQKQIILENKGRIHREKIITCSFQQTEKCKWGTNSFT